MNCPHLIAASWGVCGPRRYLVYIPSSISLQFRAPVSTHSPHPSDRGLVGLDGVSRCLLHGIGFLVDRVRGRETSPCGSLDTLYRYSHPPPGTGFRSVSEQEVGMNRLDRPGGKGLVSCSVDPGSPVHRWMKKRHWEGGEEREAVKWEYHQSSRASDRIEFFRGRISQ
ncbi:hypothetical protein SUGI_1489800 [Cryptomeria japonica]|uniref:Uncharacterized protein n=1 Tax=Cryptomeria japonica TaxID=3369 RepID=A0AAD3RPT1_CRYJA|nr:hypothetical protein SUGI_1487730 [Cryptomeria japonica]GLJ59047.1 hypothetical protein SUGI_1489800 [Cryptomeria japonica]